MKTARDVFCLDAFWRPISPGASEFIALNAETVLDGAHRLIWQRSGSQFTMDGVEEASLYIRELNSNNFAGWNTWRIPTVDELMTLMKKTENIEAYCQPMVFDADKTRFWSADRKSYTAGWFVDVESGFVASQDLTCRFFIRAVSDYPDVLAV